MVHSIHTPTLGGLGVAIALTSFAGGYGMDVDLRKIIRSEIDRDDQLLFSESNSRFIVTVPPEKKDEFEKIMEGNACASVGLVTEEPKIKIKGLNGEYIIDSDIKHLKEVWGETLGGM